MKRLAYLLIFALIASCSGLQDSDKPADIEPAKPIHLQTKSLAMLAQNNAFAFDVFQAVSLQQSGNLFLSPYSLSAALGMLYNGADGNTKAEIAKVLGMSDYTPEEVNAYYQELTKALLEVDPSSALSLANAIWADQRVTLKQAFIDLNQKYYDAEVSTLNFLQPAAVKVINDWCNEKTKGTIPEIINTIDPATVVMLANAIYFKSSWTYGFEKSKTQNKPFHNLDGTTSTVPLMQQKEEELFYVLTDECSMVTLPYANTAFAMNLILPEEGQDLDALIASLDKDYWALLQNHRARAKVTLSMPRFKVESTLDKLVEVLMALGMQEAFSDYANFSAMLDVGVKVSDVIQKSYVSVDEEGTEAAAVTLILMEATSARPAPEKVTMVLDRPFVFAITEQSTGAILFMGKVTKL
jgi:Serine protease inhibitor